MLLYSPEDGERNNSPGSRVEIVDRFRRESVERSHIAPGRCTLGVSARDQHNGLQLVHQGATVLRGAHQLHIGRYGVQIRSVRRFRAGELHGVSVADNRLGLLFGSGDCQVRVAQGARRVGGVLVLRTLFDIAGRSRRRFRHRFRHRQAGGTVRVVIREVDGRPHDGAAAGRSARRVFLSGRRQHAETVDAEQGAEEHPGAGRVVRQDQTQDSVRGGRPD